MMKKIWHNIFFAVLMVAAISCSDGNDRYEGNIKLHESVKAIDGISVLFDEVVEDSRCPTSVVCVWEGRAVVGLDLMLSGDQVHHLTLIDHPGIKEQSDTTVVDYYIKLLSVKPYPEEAGGIPEDDYSIDLLVEKIN